MKKEIEANRHQASCLGLPSKWESLDMNPGSCSQPTFFTTMQGPPEHHSPLTLGQRARNQGYGEEPGATDLDMFMNYSLVFKEKLRGPRWQENTNLI